MNFELGQAAALRRCKVYVGYKKEAVRKVLF